MRVLVCGGRHYANMQRVRAVLDEIHAASPIDEIIHGGALGADTLAHGWALVRDIEVIVCPAHWTLGKQAGPLRNQRMIDKWKPNLCVSFPGGRGTKDMSKRAEKAGIPVRYVSDGA